MTKWPELIVDDWRETRDGLQLRLQIIGKLTLSGTAPQNHWWHVPLRLSPRGLRTPLLTASGAGEFDVEVDLIDHHVDITTGNDSRRVELRAEPLNQFYKSFTTALAELDIQIETLARPVEVPDPATPFAQDTGHAAYDPDSVNAFWRLLKSIDAVFDSFGSDFVGKQSRPGLWWGGLDYAAARYSGRLAPQHPGGAPNVADWVMHEGYSHEVAAYGYFADAGPEGAFYAYTYPTPDGYRDQPMPAGVEWNDQLGEWLLSYKTVRESVDPEATLHAFLTAAHQAAATTAAWPADTNRASH